MKLNNYPDIKENELGAVADDHGDEEKGILEDVLAKPLASNRDAIGTSFREIQNKGKIEGVIIGKVIS